LIAALGAIVLIRRGEHAAVPTNSKLMRAEMSGGPKALALRPSRSVVGD